MSSLRSSIGSISFVPTRKSYFYEELPCLDLATPRSGLLSFLKKGPNDGSVNIEIHTKKNCTASAHKTTSIQDSGFLDDRFQMIRFPLELFMLQGANMNAVVGLNWTGWESERLESAEWSIGDIELLCPSHSSDT
ncbi:hypothetical protein F4804DRAFT_319571 [Jackrogersella minutella]|nr:hypothetical protein F4804DRAFT_319571 [Jackrogersella minutella]